MKLTPHQKKKKKKGLCVATRCMRQHAENKSFCHTCSKKKCRESNPVKYAFFNLRTNAKRRGKEFSLTFEDFEIFLKRNPDYMKKKGKSCRKLSIDRIDVNKGYVLSNIRAITVSENSRKRHIEYNHTNPEADNYVPF